MEHEDNTQFENYAAQQQQQHQQQQQQQHRMENMQISDSDVGVCGVGGGDNAVDLLAGIGGNNVVHGKFEEQDDDEEWKYIKEVQQSEKQLKEDGGVSVDVGNNIAAIDEHVSLFAGNANGNGFYEQHEQQQHAPDLLGQFGEKADDFYAAVHVATHGTIDAYEEEDEVEIIKKDDGDFSSTSNTTSTAGEDDLLHHHQQQQQQQQQQSLADIVELKIESGDNVLLAEQEQQEQQVAQPFEEEEPSSVATTTNGTSSLSENMQAAPVEQTEKAAGFYDYDGFDEKENFDPHADTTERAFDNATAAAADLHAFNFNLNPNAQEFVPTFGSGSNATSPTSPLDVEEVLQAAIEQQATDLPYGDAAQQLSALPRHLLDDAADDDFVAQSPRKGRVTNMDAISLPGENEFEKEADERPHELEEDDDLPFEQLNVNGSGGGGDAEQQLKPAALTPEVADCPDFQRQSPASFIDHGPETSVDLDAAEAQKLLKDDVDIMERSIHGDETAEEGDEPIEDVFNSVQPLPIDVESGNSSFVEEQFNEQLQQAPEEQEIIAEKESLNVEEKEHISQSPSTEELEMNLRNDAVSSYMNELHEASAPAFEQPQLPLDMKESFYMENTSSDMQAQDDVQELMAEVEQQHEHSLLADTTLPMDAANSSLLGSYEQQAETIVTATTTAASVGNHEDLFNMHSAMETEAVLTPSSTDEKHLIEETKEFETVVTPSSMEEQHLMEENKEFDNVLTPSSTEEKHLVEDTKEHMLHELSDDLNNVLHEAAQATADSFQQLEQQFNQMHLEQACNVDTTLQTENVADDATTTTTTTTMNTNNAFDEQRFDADDNDDQFNQQQQEEKLVEAQNQRVEESFFKEIDQQQQEYVQIVKNIEQQEEAEEIIQNAEPEPVAEREEEPLVATAMESMPEIVQEPIQEVIAAVPAETAPEMAEEMLETAAPAAEPEIEIVAAVPEQAPAVMAPEVPATVDLQPEEAIEAAPSAEIKEEAPETPSAEIKEEAPETPIVAENASEVAATAAIAATTAIAATAVAAGVAAAIKSDTKKPAAAKTTTTAAKPKVGASGVTKKPSDLTVKKATSTTHAARLTSTTNAAARPRTAPVAASKSTTSTDRKPAAAAAKPPTKSATTGATTARKPTTTTSTTAAAKTAAKPATAAPRPATAPAKPAAARTATTTAAPRAPAPIRKPAATGAASTNGTAAKPRTSTTTTSSATSATKPTTLSASAAKPKLSSPRANLTTQLRKTAPSAGSASSGAKSPTKPPTNGIGTSKSSLSATSRASKTNTSTTSAGSGAAHTTTTTTTSKTFTARPAPKFIHSTTSTTSTTTRRATLGATTTSSSANITATKTSSTSAVRKTSPTKPATGGKLSPVKSATATKTKTTKDATANSKSPVKPKSIEKPAITNGTPETAAEAVPHMNGNAETPHAADEQQQNGFAAAYNVDNNVQAQLEQAQHEQQLEPPQQQPAEISLMDA